MKLTSFWLWSGSPRKNFEILETITPVTIYEFRTPESRGSISQKIIGFRLIFVWIWRARFELRAGLLFWDSLCLRLSKKFDSYCMNLTSFLVEQDEKLMKNKGKSIYSFSKLCNFRQKFWKRLAHLAVQTLAVFSNLRQAKNCQCFADDCIQNSPTMLLKKAT